MGVEVAILTAISNVAISNGHCIESFLFIGMQAENKKNTPCTFSEPEWPRDQFGAFIFAAGCRLILPYDILLAQNLA